MEIQDTNAQVRTHIPGMSTYKQYIELLYACSILVQQQYSSILVQSVYAEYTAVSHRISAADLDPAAKYQVQIVTRCTSRHEGEQEGVEKDLACRRRPAMHSTA